MKLTCIATVLLIAFSRSISCREGGMLDEATTCFRVPNPFKEKLLDPEGHYYIRSRQTLYSRFESRKSWDVGEYFSLETGISFSVHSERAYGKPDESNNSSGWTIITDSPHGKSYIVRHTTDSRTGRDQFDCELDHVHNGRHIFPWVYEYKLDQSDKDASLQTRPGRSRNANGKPAGGKRTRADTPKTSLAAIYGIGAIWMNAIASGACTKHIEIDSYTKDNNLWQFYGQDINVYMRFNKLNRSAPDELITQETLDELSSLSSILVLKHNNYKAEPGRTGTIEQEHITELKLERNLTKKNSQELAKLYKQLNQCRKGTKSHRAFPHLMHDLTRSPQRLYDIQYISRKYPFWPDGRYQGQFNESRHRYLHPIEMVREVFSLTREAQVEIYEPLPFRGQGPGHDRVDVFIKRFNEPSEKSGELRSTLHYHLIENSASQIEKCTIGEREAAPANELFKRPIHFLIPDRSLSFPRYTGQLTGLGALLMNVADIPYKTFTLQRSNISVNRNPFKLDELSSLMVDEWLVVDHATGWVMHFFFDASSESEQQSFLARSRGDITRLVRVDIRNPRDVVKSDNLTVDMGEDLDPDHDLLARFDILEFKFENAFPHQDLDFLTRPMDHCVASDDKQVPSDSDDNTDDDDDDDDLGLKEPARFDWDSSDDEEYTLGGDLTDHGKPSEIKQNEAGLMEAGQLSEDYSMPDLFEYMGATSAYRITSRVSLVYDGHDGAHDANESRDSNHIYMVEHMDFEQELFKLEIFESEADYYRGHTNAVIFISYSNELLFQVRDHDCKPLDELDGPYSWLRLLSTNYNYYVVPQVEGRLPNSAVMLNEAVVESTGIPMFGVGALWQHALESEMIRYMGHLAEPFVDPKTGKKSKQRIWVDESFGMQVAFNFLYQNKALAAEKNRTAYTGARLNYIELNNIYNPQGDDEKDEQSSFIKSKIEVMDLSPIGPRRVHPPAECYEIIRESRGLKEVHGQNVELPSFSEYLLGSSSYEASYSLDYGKSGESETQLIDEVFSIKDNRGRISVGLGPSRVEIYIEGSGRKILSYSPGDDQCKAMTSFQPFGDLRPLLDYENNHFELEKMYGLAGLWKELSYRNSFLRVIRRADSSGTTHRYYIYTIRLEAGDGQGQKLTRLVEMDFEESFLLKEAPGGDAEKDHPSDESLKLKSIHFGPIERNDIMSPTNGNHYEMRIQVEHLTPLQGEGPRLSLPPACVALLSGAEVSKKQMSQDNIDSPKAESGDEEKRRQTTTDLDPLWDFPRLSNLLSRLNHYHMKSELTLRLASDPGETVDNNNLVILDEWVHNSMVRMQAHAIGLDPKRLEFDFLLYIDSREIFDLSKRYNCRQTFPSPAGFRIPTQNSSNLFDFWSSSMNTRSSNASDANQVVTIYHPAQLYYGPLALWLLAERNLAQIKLIGRQSVRPSPDGESPSDDDKQDQELYLDTWRVDGGSADFSWTYDMTFRYHMLRNKTGEQLRSWHTLEKIEFQNSPRDGSGFSKISIEVANIQHHDAALPITQHFVLPIGWGCERYNAQAEGNMWDDFIASALEKHPIGVVKILSYEATLDVYEKSSSTTSSPEFMGADDIRIDSDNLEELAQLDSVRKSSPYLSGSIIRQGGSDLKLNICSHLARTHYANGTTTATRTVVDGLHSIAYLIDLPSGSCSYSYNNQANCTVLDFKTDQNEPQQVYLNDKMMDILFMNTRKNNYTLLQKFSSLNGQTTTRYERQYPHLFVTKKLRGSASVVRQFIHHRHRPLPVDFSESKPTRMHDSIQVKVFIYDTDRENLLGLVRVVLYQEQPIPLTEVIRRINLFQCFNMATGSASANSNEDPLEKLEDRQLASFTVEYPLDAITRAMARFKMGKISENFYRLLLNQTGLSALQLDGNLRAQFNTENSLLRMHFNILDAPPVNLYFRRKFDATMKSALLAVAELKLVARLEQCARWCSQLDCIALSYSELDRLCYIIDEQSVRRNFHLAADGDSLRQFISHASVRLAGSSYLYLDQEKRPLTLREFAGLMEQDLNSVVDRANKTNPWALSIIPNQYIEPTNFYQSSWSKFYWHLEDRDKPYLADQRDAGPMDTEFVYAIMEQFHEIDISKAIHGYRWKIIATNQLDSCLRECENSRCLLVSYCKQIQRCTQVHAQDDQLSTDHIIHLDVEELSRKFAKPNELCSIMMHDYRPKFNRLHYTSLPDKYVAKYEGYSAMECALLCQLAGIQCLSFDHCMAPATIDANDTGSLEVGAPVVAGRERTQVCFLQQTHLELATFKQSKLSYCPQVTYNHERVSCDHYSKSTLMDFVEIKNRKLLHRLDTSIRGFNAERCSLDCLQDDECWAFEYCYNNIHEPSQTCHFLRFENTLDPSGPVAASSDDIEKRISKHLKFSRTCSIFIEDGPSYRRRLNQVSQANKEFLEELLINSRIFLSSTFGKIALFACYLLGSALVGMILQVAHIRLIGRPMGW